MHKYASDQYPQILRRRLINIGPIGDDLLVVVVHTNRAGMIRIISARKANRRESRRYHDYFKTKA
ncbi:MAG: BrnT family toxin [Burkholderiales bacterium]